MKFVIIEGQHINTSTVKRFKNSEKNVVIYFGDKEPLTIPGNTDQFQKLLLSTDPKRTYSI